MVPYPLFWIAHHQASEFYPDITVMRIAVAGTGELAQSIARCINYKTSHHAVLLSREQRPQFSKGCQVVLVDYSDMASLGFALRGIDTLISTVTGAGQIQLIHAAVFARVRRFALAEFEGLPSMRSHNDPLDRGRAAAQELLQYYAQHIQSTAFVCGIFYERFQPGGFGQSRMGLAAGVGGDGAYIMNCQTMAAEVPCYNGDHESNVGICATAIEDVARFVTHALDLPQWPPEMRMRGQRILVKDLVVLVQRLMGRDFDPLHWHNADSLRSELQLAVLNQDMERQNQLRALIATAEGQYDFEDCNLNLWFPDVRPVSFEDWFVHKWNLQGI
ncbi:NAD(P)-binding protein [Teratosphaeria destructans]|uniref:NAD(P)-binding protein n=1 Tax=Teratosphaeria destructans TaxID=418781 RepID=A0A9W7STW0_9PEZI|nr:NAD(P)-binding protein [Teratosphaeria destructans]